MRGKVVAQRAGIRSLEGNVRKPVFRGAGQAGENLDILMIVHLEISQQEAARRLIHR